MEKKCQIKLVDYGSIKALVNVISNGMEINGFKVIETDGKPWVAVPSKEINKDGQKTFKNLIWFTDPTDKEKFNDWVLEEYNTALSN